MNFFKKMTILFSLCFFSMTLFAQPGLKHNHDEHQGCHFTKSQIEMTPLTEEEKVLLTESNERSDTIDILNYAINLDITDFNGQTIAGNCEVTIAPKMDNVNYISLDLLDFNISCG